MPKLLPPLQLYRHILRVHRSLPAIQRELGDSYVKHEFRIHQNIENPEHIISFLVTWHDYLKQLTEKEWQRSHISQETIDSLSEDQVIQIHELMKEIKKLNT